jgi:hypothetical protein
MICRREKAWELTCRRYTETWSIEHQRRTVVDDQVEEPSTHSGSRGGFGSQQYGRTFGEVDVAERSDRDAVSSDPKTSGIRVRWGTRSGD